MHVCWEFCSGCMQYGAQLFVCFVVSVLGVVLDECSNFGVWLCILSVRRLCGALMQVIDVIFQEVY